MTVYDTMEEKKIKYLFKIFAESMNEMIPLNSVSQTPHFTGKKTELRKGDVICPGTLRG